MHENQSDKALGLTTGWLAVLVYEQMDRCQHVTVLDGNPIFSQKLVGWFVVVY